MNAQDYEAIWNSLSGAAREVLRCLCQRGPTWDGDVPSKAGRDELVQKGLAAKIVLKDARYGYQAATYLGASIYEQYMPSKRMIVALFGGR